MKLEPIIGLEIHIQLGTNSKMFCSCDNRSELLPPNTAICPTCLAQPGTLPVPNAGALRSAIKLGLALGCSIAPRLKFDRKHYFYPDLPKGYQISQFDEPICENGTFTFHVPGTKVDRSEITIGIERAHLEEDSAKSFHGSSGETLVDFNRAGSPLVETVTRPDFKTPLEAKTFLQEMRLLVRALGISDGDMEKGHMRCDANISLRPVGDTKLYTKTEIKNMNSFRSVERAIAYEIERQTALWEAGTPPVIGSTRNWNDVEQKTTESRTKEAAQDYRFFPEPDIPPFIVGSLVEEMRRELPELPSAKYIRFQKEYGFSAIDARQLIENDELATYAEHVASEFLNWATDSDPDANEDGIKTKSAKLLSGWLLSKYPGALNELGRLFTPETVTAENFAEFLTLIYQSKINSTSAMMLLKKMIETRDHPHHLLESENLSGADEGATSTWIDEVITENPAQVAGFKSGKEALLQFLVGQVMKKSRGTADALSVAEEIRSRLL
jgi:aspartyl-tRNA(Asn)/glutamyl-tRNA(Gln) amidotransferase subunit B